MEEQFGTKDLYLAAALITLGGKYSRADKSEPRHMIFYFDAVDGIDYDEIHTQWVNGTLKGN